MSKDKDGKDPRVHDGKPPLATVCGFLPTAALNGKVEGARRLGLLSSLKAEFLEQMAESFSDDEEPA